MKFLIFNKEEVQQILHDQCHDEHEQNHHKKCKSVIWCEWVLWRVHRYDYDLSYQFVFWIQSNHIDQNILKSHHIQDTSETIATNNVIIRYHQLHYSVCKSHNQDLEEFA